MNNNFVKSGLITGRQYDTVMRFINGKKDGMGNVFNVTYGVSQRFTQGTYVTAINKNDLVCNIYDLQGSGFEVTAEVSANGTVIRGGSNGIKVGSGATWSASMRGCSAEGRDDCIYRMVLYVII